MTLTYGFFNSVNGDRRYDADDFSRLFDGILTDGVFPNIGDHFTPKFLSEEAFEIGTGRAWFDRTWTNNSTPLMLTPQAPDVVYPRIDSVILEVNHKTRENRIFYDKGVPASNPSPKGLIKTDDVRQYRLAKIEFPVNGTFSAQIIKTCVGTSECPIIQGVLHSFTDQDFTKSITNDSLKTNKEMHELKNTLLNLYTKEFEALKAALNQTDLSNPQDIALAIAQLRIQIREAIAIKGDTTTTISKKDGVTIIDEKAHQFHSVTTITPGETMKILTQITDEVSGSVKENDVSISKQSDGSYLIDQKTRKVK